MSMAAGHDKALVFVLAMVAGMVLQDRLKKETIEGLTVTTFGELCELDQLD